MVSYVINEETQLHGLGGITLSYLSDIPFEQLDDGYTTECRPGMIFVTWYIVKLNCYVNFCHDYNIFIVANNISHIGVNRISWTRGVVDVNHGIRIF